MVKAGLKGHLYSVNPNIDTNELSKRQKGKYRQLKNRKSAYYLAITSSQDRVLCAPVHTEKVRRAVRISLSDNVLYAICCDPSIVHPSWLIESDITEIVDEDTVAQIYDKYLVWKDKVTKKQRRIKERQKAEDRKYANMFGKVKREFFPKEKASSSVVWSCTHPLQGGRTSSK